MIRHHAKIRDYAMIRHHAKIRVFIPALIVAVGLSLLFAAQTLAGNSQADPARLASSPADAQLAGNSQADPARLASSPADAQLAGNSQADPSTIEAKQRHSFLRVIAHVVAVAWSGIGLFIALQTGLSAKLRDYVNSLSKRNIARIAVYYSCMMLSLFIFTLPIYVAGDYFLGLAFHQERESFFIWLLARVIDTLLDLTVAIPSIWIVFALIKRFPRTWGAYVFALVSAAALVRMLVSPFVLDVINHGYHPFPQGELRSRLERLAYKCGIDSPVLLVEEEGALTSEINAFVAASGSAVRIVVFDTALENLKDDEIEIMVAHEIGHYKLKHLWLKLVLGLATSGLLLAGASILAPYVVQRMPGRWGITGVCDIAVLPAAWIMFYFASFVLSLGGNLLMRSMELQADRYALEVTKNPDAMVRELNSYSRLNVVDPDPPPIVMVLFHQHPSIKERISHALRWKEAAQR